MTRLGSSVDIHIRFYNDCLYVEILDPNILKEILVQAHRHPGTPSKMGFLTQSQREGQTENWMWSLYGAVVDLIHLKPYVSVPLYQTWGKSEKQTQALLHFSW